MKTIDNIDYGIFKNFMRDVIEDAYKRDTAMWNEKVEYKRGGQFVTHSTGSYYFDGNEYNVNITNITTKLIQETGRFVEDYASDLLIDIDAINRDLKEKGILEEPTIHICALRKSGVDGETFYYNRVRDNKSPEDYYRRVFAVVIIPGAYYSDRDFNANSVDVCLYDLTNEIYSHRKAIYKAEGREYYW